MKIHHRAPITKGSDIRYKFVELSIVTDETIEQTVNEWIALGWTLDGIRFVVTEASRRPSMAFISFVRDMEQDPIADMGGIPSGPHNGGESGPH